MHNIVKKNTSEIQSRIQIIQNRRTKNKRHNS